MRILIYRTVFLLLLGASLSAAAYGEAVRKSSLVLPLGDSQVKVTIHEKEGARITFFSPHRNEKIALELARTAVETHGGRLVSIESFDESGRPTRNLRFMVGGVSYSVDPNRIFTENGRGCSGLPAQAAKAVEDLAERLIKVLLPPSRTDLFVAVHNNTDHEQRADKRRVDLTAPAFSSRLGGSAGFFHQTSGVYLSNAEEDDDNFVLVSATGLVSHFADRGFNVVVQKPAHQLRDQRCTVDDGSFSIYAGQNGLTYICLEADARSGSARQAQMFDAVLALSRNRAIGITEAQALQ